MSKITLNQFSALQNLFDYFNRELFGGELPQCLLNLSRQSKAYGFFAPDRWVETQDADKKLHEISLNPDHIARDPKAVLGTLVHEMVHLWQQEFGSPSPGYHNKEWAAKMKEVGLYPSTTGAEGGKETGKNCSHYIITGGPYDLAFQRMDKDLLYPFICKPAIRIVKPNKNKTKYTCACGTNIWGKEGLQVTCSDCGEYFEQQS